MPFDPQHHHRRSIRLPGYDYAQPGAYFVTVCAYDRSPIFGAIVNGIMRVNWFGAVVQSCWRDLSRHYRGLVLDVFVVMPNHIHGIILFTEVGAGFPPAVPGLDVMGRGDARPNACDDGSKPAPTSRRTLSEVVRGFKTYSARGINRARHTLDMPVWQRNYYEHVIRDDADLARIREYIQNNPLAWDLDEENPHTPPHARGS